MVLGIVLFGLLLLGGGVLFLILLIRWILSSKLSWNERGMHLASFLSSVFVTLFIINTQLLPQTGIDGDEYFFVSIWIILLHVAAFFAYLLIREIKQYTQKS